MALRKEQVLLLLVIGYAAWQWGPLTDSTVRRVQFNPTAKEYAPAPVTSLVTLPPAPALPPRAAGPGLFVEPSETQPLPPMPLPFPEREPLSLAALPVPGGLAPGRLHLATVSGRTVRDLVLTADRSGGAAATDTAPAPDTPPAQETNEQKKARASRLYDRVYPQGLSEPWFGILELPSGVDRFELEKRTEFAGLSFRLLQFSIAEWKMKTPMTFEGDKVGSIRLADTLRNEVERQKRSIPETPTTLQKRRDFIEWLLARGREEVWAFDEALAQAELYSRIDGGDLDGYRIRVHVLRARGDLAGEHELYRNLPQKHQDSAFQKEGLGRLAARLGLWDEAERELRAATRLQPGDSRPWSALAEFLLDRGREAEAYDVAGRSLVAIGSLAEPVGRARVARTAVRARVAMGDLAGAREALALAGQPLPYAQACIDYAAGEVDSAASNFRLAADSDGATALLGLGACLVRQGQLQAAVDAFVTVADQAPLLRHRAWTGVALAMILTGQGEQALAMLERAFEADPKDWYAWYLRGRVLREAGSYQPAQEALERALAQRDDFVHALTEMAQLRGQMARDGSGVEQARDFVAAMRYVDRAVILARGALPSLFEMQGLVRFFAGDTDAAEAAFGQARDAATSDDARLYARAAIALCEYARNQVDDARRGLDDLRRDLKSDHAMAKYANEMLTSIDDHSQKERLEDRFERDEAGSIWLLERDGALAPALAEHALRIRGRFPRTGEVYAWRDKAVQAGGRFLAVSVLMKLGAGHAADHGFAGLRIETVRSGGGSGAVNLRAQLGVRDGRPYLTVEDGKEEPFRADLQVADFDARGDQRLELRVVPRDDTGRNFSLTATWNGQRVLQARPINGLSSNTREELRTVLFAGGNKDGAVDVRFDDYLLERRKDG